VVYNLFEIKTADNQIPALQDINIKVKKGDTLGIIGRNGSGKSITNIQEKGPEGKVIQSIVTKGPKGLAGLSFTIERDANGNFIVKDDLFGESKTFQTQQQVDDYLKSNGVDAEMYDELDNTTTPNPSDLDIPSECLDAWSKVVGEDPIDKSPDRRWTDPSPEDAAKDLGLKEMFDAINQCMISRTGFVVKCDDLIRCPEDVSCPCTGQYYTDPTGLQIPCAPIIDCGPDEYLDVNCNCVDFGQVEGVLPPPVPVRRPLLGDILTEF
jgi:hypothetical protein